MQVFFHKHTTAPAHEISSRETSVDVTLGANSLLQSTNRGHSRIAFDNARRKRHDKVCLREMGF